jgi:hypothetical protein
MMETIKIYISLKEAEELIFNRFLIFAINRIEVKRAQGLMSITFEIEKNKLIEFENNYVVLFSTVRSFEIPEKEQNLFLNHYRLPLGLLEYSTRIVRDSSNENSVFDEQRIEYNPKKYLQLRNGLIGIFENGYVNINNAEFIFSAKSVINQFYSLSKFKQELLVSVFEQSKFPLLNVKIDKFVTDNFYRVTWWGKFIVDNYLNKLDNKTPEEIDVIKKWLRGFLHFDSIAHINQQINNIPEELNDEIDFILGYYFASVYFEYIQSDKNFLNKLISEIRYNNINLLHCWVSFFKSLFDENKIYLYFVKSLSDEVLEIEKMAFDLSNNNFSYYKDNIFEFNFNSINKEKLIKDFLALKVGGNDHNPQMIASNKAKSIFINNFSQESLKFNGFEIKSEYDRDLNFINTCLLSDNKFSLNLNCDANISEIVFFIEDHSKIEEYLKNLKLKVKPFSKLIDKNKKVLIGFIKMGDLPNLIYIYSKLVRGDLKKQFEKIIFILLVDLDSDKVQSLEFENHRKGQEDELNKMFNDNIELIIKNTRSNNDVEIKRNLKNVLKNYRMEQIEVIDENFDENKANWILESNTEYIINNENEQYYSFFNMD